MSPAYFEWWQWLAISFATFIASVFSFSSAEQQDSGMLRVVEFVLGIVSFVSLIIGVLRYFWPNWNG